MKTKNLGLIGAIAGAAAVVAILYYRRDDVSKISENLVGSAKNLGGKLRDYTNQLKDRILHNVHGPHGEQVYLDMYDRQFYEDDQGRRVYMDNA